MIFVRHGRLPSCPSFPLRSGVILSGLHADVCCNSSTSPCLMHVCVMPAVRYPHRNQIDVMKWLTGPGLAPAATQR